MQDKVMPDYYRTLGIGKDIDNYANLMLSTNAHLRERCDFESLRDAVGINK